MSTAIRQPRRVRARRLIALGTAAATGLVAAEAIALDRAMPHGDAGGDWRVTQLTTSVGEGGEGGESGGADKARDDDARFLADLGLIEGHLRVGIALYEAGEVAMAETHMKHPGDEIYTNLVPHLQERGAEGFSGELAELAGAVEGGAPVAKAREVFGEVLHEIEEARERAGGGGKSRLGAIVIMTRVAADEYAVGVVDGQLANLHEYQDAWGFLQAARGMADELCEMDDQAVREAAETILAQVAETEAAFLGIAPSGMLPAAGASILYGAAARMELASLKVK